MWESMVLQHVFYLLLFKLILEMKPNCRFRLVGASRLNAKNITLHDQEKAFVSAHETEAAVASSSMSILKEGGTWGCEIIKHSYLLICTGHCRSDLWWFSTLDYFHTARPPQCWMARHTAQRLSNSGLASLQPPPHPSQTSYLTSGASAAAAWTWELGPCCKYISPPFISSSSCVQMHFYLVCAQTGQIELFPCKTSARAELLFACRGFVKDGDE